MLHTPVRRHPFSGEKMTVTMALYRADDIEHAIELTNGIQAYQGQGHSCGIYSTSDDNIMKLALATKTSRCARRHVTAMQRPRNGHVTAM